MAVSLRWSLVFVAVIAAILTSGIWRLPPAAYPPPDAPENSFCTNLTRTDCESDARCLAIYGSSRCSGAICTTDFVFKGCRLRNPQNDG